MQQCQGAVLDCRDADSSIQAGRAGETAAWHAPSRPTHSVPPALGTPRTCAFARTSGSRSTAAASSGPGEGAARPCCCACWSSLSCEASNARSRGSTWPSTPRCSSSACRAGLAQQRARHSSAASTAAGARCRAQQRTAGAEKKWFWRSEGAKVYMNSASPWPCSPRTPDWECQAESIPVPAPRCTSPPTHRCRPPAAGSAPAPPVHSQRPPLPPAHAAHAWQSQLLAHAAPHPAEQL